MPKPIKKKVTKKKKIDEGELKGAAVHTFNLLKEKKRILIYSLSALGVVIVLAAILAFYVSSTKKRAYAFEKDAYNYYYSINLKNSLTDKERWEKSLELFQKAVKIKSTPAVQFYIGNCYFNLGDYGNAINAYLGFIDKYKDNQDMLPLVYQKLSSAYMRNNKNEDAIKTLNALAQLRNGIFSDTALILEARYYEVTGKHEDAMKKYKELVNDFPLSLWSNEARAKIEIEGKKQIDETAQSEEPAPENGGVE